MKHLDVLDLTDAERELIREAEVQGSRTLFERNGRPVAVLTSWDEYLAMRETLEIASDSLLYARIESADEEVRQGRVLLLDELLENAGVPTADMPSGWNDRLRIAESAETDWGGITAGDRQVVVDAFRRIDDDPIVGAPLFDPLKGLWTFRSRKIRIVYRIVAEGRFIAILTISRAAPVA